MNIIKYTDTSGLSSIILAHFNGTNYIIKHIYTNVSNASKYFKVGNLLEIFMGCIHIDNKKFEIISKHIDGTLSEILTEQCQLRDQIKINEDKIKELDYQLLVNNGFTEIMF
jgi:hypothetical protein